MFTIFLFENGVNPEYSLSTNDPGNKSSRSFSGSFREIKSNSSDQNLRCWIHENAIPWRFVQKFWISRWPYHDYNSTLRDLDQNLIVFVNID